MSDLLVFAAASSTGRGTHWTPVHTSRWFQRRVPPSGKVDVVPHVKVGGGGRGTDFSNAAKVDTHVSFLILLRHSRVAQLCTYLCYAMFNFQIRYLFGRVVSES